MGAPSAIMLPAAPPRQPDQVEQGLLHLEDTIDQLGHGMGVRVADAAILERGPDSYRQESAIAEVQLFERIKQSVQPSESESRGAID